MIVGLALAVGRLPSSPVSSAPSTAGQPIGLLLLLTKAS